MQSKLKSWARITFNSLYEILNNTVRSSINYSWLSILFMRFLQLYCFLVLLYNSFNSLYEIPEELFIGSQFITYTLSILFMRFLKVPGFFCCKIGSNFQFSLWDSKKENSPGILCPGCLSILFMRFNKSSILRDLKIKNFQFSLWDSYKIFYYTIP